jgi:hemolysin activation/secretion protein
MTRIAKKADARNGWRPDDGRMTLRVVALIWLAAAPLATAAEDGAQAAGTTPSPAAAPAPAATAPVAEAPNEPRFAIREFRVSGVTLLDRRAVERAVYPFLGENRRFADVDGARAAVEALYRERGYETATVDIPEQSVKGGIVRLTATERRIGEVRVKGSRYFLPSQIRAAVAAAEEGKVPLLPEFKGELAVLNRIQRDRIVTPVLRAGKQPDTVDIDLIVRDTLPLHGSLSVDNRYILNTTHTRLNGALRYDNLFQKAHSLGLQFQVSPQDTDEVQVYGATYVAPLERPGRTLVGYAVDSNSDVAALADTTVVGDGRIYGLRFIESLYEGTSSTHSVILGADYKEFGESVQVLGEDSNSVPISYIPWTAQWNANWRHGQSGGNSLLGFVVGVRGLANSEEEFANKRFGARPNFAILRGTVEERLPLPAGLQLGVKADGQKADSPLISNEQYFAGGMDSVRGYLEAQVFGDDGLRTNLELRSPNFGPSAGSFLDEGRAYVFYDWARLTVQDALPGQEDQFTLAGSGIGLRFEGPHIKLSIDQAVALRDDGVVERGDWRTHFSVEGRF